jgi:putative membrane protein
MTLAFIFGAIFLVSYVIYHASVEPTRFGGEGLVRIVYFSVLISHIILAAIVLPFVLLSFYYAWTEKFERHRKVVKYAFPIWLYVSVTGVIAYLMIAPYYEF